MKKSRGSLRRRKQRSGSARLLELYEQGEALALRLAEEYGAYLSGAAPLDAVYRFNFESEKTADEGEQDEIQTDEG